MSFSSNSDHSSKNASYNTVYASPKKYGTFSTLFLNKISRGKCIVAVPSVSSSSLTSAQIVEANQVNIYNNYKTASKFFTTSMYEAFSGSISFFAKLSVKITSALVILEM